MDENEILHIASLSLDEQELEVAFFNEDEKNMRVKHYDLYLLDFYNFSLNIYIYIYIYYLDGVIIACSSNDT